MIESITIANVATYTSTPETLTALSQLIYLFGSNGTGKTTISRVIADESSFPACKVNWKGGTKLVEGRGFGMRTFGEAAAKHSLPVPKYAFDGLYLNLTIYRHARAAVQAFGTAVLEKLSKSERAGWEWISLRQQTTSSEYADATKLP